MRRRDESESLLSLSEAKLGGGSFADTIVLVTSPKEPYPNAEMRVFVF